MFTTQVELARKKSIAMQLGQWAVVAQLDAMIGAINIERQERMIFDRQRLMPNNPVMIETDQQLRAAEQTPDEPVPLRGASGRTPRRPIRSAKPQI
jgi:hypothetical protein